MSTSKLPCIPSLRKQQLHLEFASLRHAAPPGVYMSLAPGDPTLWNGVIFVRSDPLPRHLPRSPPLVTFATDLFHPLIVPLTTYTFSTGSASDNPVSATDEERLPPGGFSLRHGFPHWFGRAKRSGLVSGNSPRNVSGTSASVASTERRSSGGPVKDDGGEMDMPKPSVSSATGENTDVGDSRLAQTPASDQFAEQRTVVPVSEILDYIRSTFDDEMVLDSLPLEAAGNPGAWHAWLAHRRGGDARRQLIRGSPQARLPGDWHWEGIWARRVKSEIDNSISDPMLFGSAARGSVDEMIRFSRLDESTMSSVKEKMAAMAGNEI
ncbi:Ubiquitin-conjugating enzyme [Penicillium sp. DV-2018c]|nr:Ubiquitin-conjugating enzyme [Penicillium sp. DV-2018c]